MLKRGCSLISESGCYFCPSSSKPFKILVTNSFITSALINAMPPFLVPATTSRRSPCFMLKSPLALEGMTICPLSLTCACSRAPQEGVDILSRAFLNKRLSEWIRKSHSWMSKQSARYDMDNLIKDCIGIWIEDLVLPTFVVNMKHTPESCPMFNDCC